MKARICGLALTALGGFGVVACSGGASATPVVETPTFADASAPEDASPTTQDARMDDAAQDASDVRPTCTITQPFTSTADLGLALTAATLRADELELFGVDGTGTLVRTARASKLMPFGPLQPVVMPSPAKKISMFLALDALKLYLTAFVRSGNEPGDGHPELFVASRASMSDNFSPPSPLALKAPVFNLLTNPHLGMDGSDLYVTHVGGGGMRVLRVLLPGGTIEDAYATGTEVFAGARPVNTNGNVLARDGLTLYTSTLDVMAAGGLTTGTGALAVSSRASTAAQFGVPVRLAAPTHIDGTDEHPVWLSPDQCRLYYVSSGPSSALRVALRAP